MATLSILNSKALRRFTKDSLTVLGVFAVLSFGFATVVLFFGINIDNDCFVKWLLGTLVVVPVLSFFGFLCLMWKIYGKLCDVGKEYDLRNASKEWEENILKTIAMNTENDIKKRKADLVKEILDRLLEASSGEKWDGFNHKISCGDGDMTITFSTLRLDDDSNKADKSK